jgi:ABC-2 type transport system ATP-binding protein
VTAIVTRGLRKSYGKLEAVRGLDLTVEAGQVYALVGPNGAGKTTTVEILEGFRPRDGGEVSVLGTDPRRAGSDWRARIGIVFQDLAAEPYLSVVETLNLFSLLYPKPRGVEELLDMVDLQEQRNRKVHTLSGGQRRRLDLALGLIGDPELLFLDEPTTGFDPAARRHAWETVRRLCDLGKTVLLTTHYMDEAQHLADKVGIVVGGKLLVEGAPDAIAASQATTNIRFRLPEDTEADSLPFAATNEEGWLVMETTAPTKTLHELTGWAVESGLELNDLSVSRPSLEEIYLEVTHS